METELRRRFSCSSSAKAPAAIVCLGFRSCSRGLKFAVPCIGGKLRRATRLRQHGPVLKGGLGRAACRTANVSRARGAAAPVNVRKCSDRAIPPKPQPRRRSRLRRCAANRRPPVQCRPGERWSVVRVVRARSDMTMVSHSGPHGIGCAGRCETRNAAGGVASLRACPCYINSATNLRRSASGRAP